MTESLSSEPSIPELTIFYDGGCPLCVSEMRHLNRRDLEQKIALQDIHAPRVLPSAFPI